MCPACISTVALPVAATCGAGLTTLIVKLRTMLTAKKGLTALKSKESES